MLKQQLAGLLAGFIFKIYSSTFRYQLHFEDESDKPLFFNALHSREANHGHNLIFALFHQDDLSCIPFFSGYQISVMISQSKDGQILASAVEYMGYRPIRGSSHRGAVAGLLAAMKRVRDGYNFSIAVDGPKGPIYKVKDGITAVSEKSRRPIVPVRALPVSKKVFKKSWNQASLPLPFSRIRVLIGKIDFYSTHALEAKMLSLV